MARATESETSFWDRRAETMPRRDLEQLQATRIRSCLERLKTSGIEYYQERLSDVEPDEFRSLEDLRSIPFAVKDDLREHYPFGLFLVPRSEILRLHASTGSTGKPTVVGYTRSDLKLWADVLARGLVAGGLTDEDVFQNAYGHGLFTGGLGFHDAATRVGAVVGPTSGGNTPAAGVPLCGFRGYSVRGHPILRAAHRRGWQRQRGRPPLAAGSRGFLGRRAHDGEDGARDRGEDGGRGLRAVRPLRDHRPRRRVGLRSLRRDARLGGS